MGPVSEEALPVPLLCGAFPQKPLGYLAFILIPLTSPLSIGCELMLYTGWPAGYMKGGILQFFVFVFLNFWLRWVFVAARGLSLVVASGDYSSLWCVGFSLRWLLLLRSTGSRRAGFSSCGAQA